MGSLHHPDGQYTQGVAYTSKVLLTSRLAHVSAGLLVVAEPARRLQSSFDALVH